ncbi:MAG: cellulase family glycosylhydrolase [Lachnospiraceae bacterium]|nr:cellulase family glycosylhydrolase [Lachnospiraceae bacterium]
MKILKKWIAAALTAAIVLSKISAPAGVYAQSAEAMTNLDFLKANGREVCSNSGQGEIVQLKGTNAGGYLIQEPWMCTLQADKENGIAAEMDMYQKLTQRFGEDHMREIIQTYQKGFWTEEDFDHIAALGMNCIRLPFWYMNLVDFEGNLLENRYERMDWFVEEAGKRGIYVILDMHGAPGSQNGSDHSGIDGGSQKEARSEFFFGGNAKANQELYYKLWEDLAGHYKGNPTVAGYDLLNEPYCTYRYNSQLSADELHELLWKIYDEAYQRIRAVDADHMLIMEATWDPVDLPDPETYGWENVMYEYHQYHYDDYDNIAGEQISSLKNKIDNIVNQDYNVPSYIGEFCLMNQPSAWEQGLELLNKTGISWTTWSYKGIETETTAAQNWCQYYLDDSRKVNAATAEYEDILARWSDNGASHINPREGFCDVVKAAAEEAARPFARKEKILTRSGGVDLEKYGGRLQAEYCNPTSGEFSSYHVSIAEEEAGGEHVKYVRWNAESWGNAKWVVYFRQAGTYEVKVRMKVEQSSDSNFMFGLSTETTGDGVTATTIDTRVTDGYQEVVIGTINIPETGLHGVKIMDGSDPGKAKLNMDYLQFTLKTPSGAYDNSEDEQIKPQILPVLYITPENGEPISSKTEYVTADMKLVGNEQFADESMLYDSTGGGDAPVQIRGRGNATWDWAVRGGKMPYKIKLGTKKDLLGMGANKHWVLLANYKDYSFMKNKLAYDLSGELGMPYMKSTWVEVVLNGSYVGTYQLAEQIRVDKNRVNIFDWEGLAEEIAKALVPKDKRDALEEQLVENLSWITTKRVTFENTEYHLQDYRDKFQIPDFNGGFLLENDMYYDEISKWKTSHGKEMNVKDPEYLNTNREMFSYIKDYVQAVEDAVYSENFYTEYQGKQVRYTELMDFDSAIKYWLVNEIFCNMDAGKNSTYMYKDIDSVLYMGPLWDMDYGAGGQNYEASQSAAYWHTTETADTNYRNWFAQMIRDPYFVEKALELYQSIRGTLIEDLLSNIDRYAAYLSASAAKDFAKWWPDYTFDGGAANFKTWMYNRIQWLDAQFASAKTLTDSFGSVYQYKADKNCRISLYTEHGTKPLTGDIRPEKNVLAKVSFGSSNVKTAECYVNGILAGKTDVSEQTASILLESSLFTEAQGLKNTIQIYGRSSGGTYTGSNYVTLVQNENARDTDLEEAKKALNEVLKGAKSIFDAGQKHYTDESWRAFQNAYEDARAAEQISDVAKLRKLAEALTEAQNDLTSPELEIAKDRLERALTAAKGISEAGRRNYTDESWRLFQNACTDAEAMKSSNDAAQLKKLAEALEYAQNALEIKDQGQHTPLQIVQQQLTDALTAAKGIYEAGRKNYTEESWSEFIKAYERAGAAKESDNVEQLRKLAGTLDAARTALITQLEASREELELALTAAEGIYGAGCKNYTRESWSLFENAYKEAEAAMRATDAQHVKTCAQALTAAQNALKKTETQYTPLEAAREELTDELTAAQGFYRAGQRNYTKQSWLSFQSAYDAALAAKESDDVEQLKKLAAALKAAKEALATPLQAAQAEYSHALQAAKSIYEAGQKNYTKESWSEFEKAYKNAEAAKGSKDIEELNGLAKELTDAQSKLKQKEELPPLTEELNKGRIFNDNQTGIQYKVTDAVKKTAAAVKGLNKNAAAVKIPDTVKISGINCKVTAIEKGAFKNFKKLKKATIGRNVETIGDSSFYGCAKLTGIDTRNAVKIGKSSFRKCTGLTGVTIGAKAAVIGDSSFYGCRRLTRVTLGKNVKNIGTKSFYGCKKLKTVILKGKKLTAIRSGAFKNTSTKMKITLPKGMTAKKRSSIKKLFQKAGTSKKAMIK